MRRLIKRFDRSLSRSIQNLPRWTKPVMDIATLIGDPIVVTAVAAFGSAVAFKQSEPEVGWAFIATVAAAGVNLALQQSLHRKRPKNVYLNILHIKSYSLPSAHAFGSLVTYGLVALVALNSVASSISQAVAVFLLGLVTLAGISRVYLGVHYPSDIVAGWLLGAGFLIAIAVAFIY